MMRDDRQLAAVCTAVCRRIPKPVELWTEHGPTDLALRWRKRSPLSSGERVLLLVAFSLWNGSVPRVTLADVVGTLSGSHLAFVGSLLVAISGGADDVDRWLAAHSELERMEQLTNGGRHD